MLPNGIAKPGDIIEIPFNLTNGQNILSFEMEVNYDHEVFEPIDNMVRTHSRIY